MGFRAYPDASVGDASQVKETISNHRIPSMVPWQGCRDARSDALNAGRPIFYAGSDAANLCELILHTGSDATNLCELILHAGRVHRDSGEHILITYYTQARQGVNHFRPCLFRNSILYNTLFKSSFQSSNQVLERLSLRSFQKTELAVWDELPFLSLKDLERRELAIL